MQVNETTQTNPGSTQHRLGSSETRGGGTCGWARAARRPRLRRPPGRRRPRTGAVQHPPCLLRWRCTSDRRKTSQPLATAHFLLVMKKREGPRGREGVVCAFCVPDHYFLTFPTTFLLQIFTNQSQLLSPASSLNLKLPLPCKCTK